MNLQSFMNLEETIIGHILTQNTGLSTVANHLRPEMFSDAKLAIIYTIAKEMYKVGEKIDILSIKENLINKNQLEAAGGNDYLIQLINNQPQETNIESQIKSLKDIFLRRKLTNSLGKILAKANNEVEPIEELLAETNLLMEEIANESIPTFHYDVISTLMEKAIAKREKKHSVTGIPTGIQELDELITGWHPGELIVLAALPSTGKTTLTLHIAKVAAESGYQTLLYSPDMPGEQLADRWLSPEFSPMDSSHTTSEKTDMEKAYTIARHLSALPLYVNDHAAINTMQIYSSALIMQSKGKCNLIVIDSIQQCETDTECHRFDREQEMEQIIRNMKSIAMKLKVPVVLTCQLKRKRNSKGSFDKPCLLDLQESIEQHADIVMLLSHSSSVKAKDSLIIAKHRNGNTKEIEL